MITSEPNGLGKRSNKSLLEAVDHVRDIVLIDVTVPFGAECKTGIALAKGRIGYTPIKGVIGRTVRLF